MDYLLHNTQSHESQVVRAFLLNPSVPITLPFIGDPYKFALLLASAVQDDIPVVAMPGGMNRLSEITRNRLQPIVDQCQTTFDQIQDIAYEYAKMANHLTNGSIGAFDHLHHHLYTTITATQALCIQMSFHVPHQMSFKHFIDHHNVPTMNADFERHFAATAPIPVVDDVASNPIPRKLRKN